jgi:hypothetical protein
MLSVSLALFAGVAFAADNSVYIDQSGSDSTIDITQTGSGNAVRGLQSGSGSDNTVRAKMYGSDSLVDIRQIGSDSTLNLGFDVTKATGQTYGIDLTYYVTGNSGTATINVNGAGTATAASNMIDIRQIGNSASTNLNMTGSKNSLTATTAGGASNSLTATINADQTTNNIAVSGGGGNSVNLNLTSNKATNNITMVGASNSTSLTQSGVAGVNGHAFTYNVTGSSNSMTAVQSGTIDTTVNVLSVGSGNTWNITTGN